MMVDDTLRMHCFKGEQQYVSSSQPFLCPWSALCSRPMVLPSILVPTCSNPSCGSFHLQGHEWHISKKNKHDVVVAPELPVVNNFLIPFKSLQPCSFPMWHPRTKKRKSQSPRQEISVTNNVLIHSQNAVLWGVNVWLNMPYIGFLSRRHQTKPKQIMHRHCLVWPLVGLGKLITEGTTTAIGFHRKRTKCFNVNCPSSNLAGFNSSQSNDVKVYHMDMTLSEWNVKDPKLFQNTAYINLFTVVKFETKELGETYRKT